MADVDEGPIKGTHQRLIDLAAAHFMEHGEFPVLSNLERQCAREGSPLDYDFSDPLPESLGFVGMGQPQAVTLNVAGLAHAQVARPFLYDVVRLAQFEHQAWIGPGEPKVTGEQVGVTFGMTDGTLIRLGVILYTEPYLHAGYHRDPGNPTVWSCDLDKAANNLKSITTVDELVELRARVVPSRSGTSAPSGAPLPPASPAIPHRTRLPDRSDSNSGQGGEPGGTPEADAPEPGTTPGFVLMPFAPELDWLHGAIKVAGWEAGVDMQRADDIALPGVVIDQVKDALEDARVVIAVCTGQNANVFFEMGMAWRIHRPILVAETTDDLPFDIRHFRVLLYGNSTPGEDRASLGQRLLESMKAVLDEPLELPRGRLLVAPPQPQQTARLSGRYNQTGNSARFTIRNSGTVDISNVTLEVPDEARPFSILTQDLPIDVLRPGEDVNLIAATPMGGGKGIFDVILRGETPDGVTHEWPAKVSR